MAYTKINHKRIIELNEAGKTTAEISEITGYTSKQIYNAVETMKKHGVKISLNRTPSIAVKSIREIENAPLTDLAPRRKRGELEPFAARIESYILREIRYNAKRLNISQAVLIERAVIKYLGLKG